MAARRLVPALAVAALLAGPAAGSAGAHAGLVRSDPAAGAALGASPSAVRLTLSERPAAQLSDIRVSDRRGVVRPTPAPTVTAADPASLVTMLPRLPRGVYSVRWRGVSAVDGHVTSGAFAFGVGERPTGAAARPTSTSPAGSGLEIVARWSLLIGLVALLGAATASVAGFAGAGDRELRLAAGGWLLAAAGVVALFEAQRRAADTSLSALLHSAVGNASIERAVAVAVAGLALLAAWRVRAHPARRRAGLGLAGVATLAAIVVHVAAGHAGAGGWPRGIAIGAQASHVAAAGVWIGGLAALLLGMRGASPQVTAQGLRRFALVAAAGIVVVAAAGTLRAVDELGAWSDLWSGAYGRAIGAKVVLLALIAALAARGRRGMRMGEEGIADPAALARSARLELVLAAAAIALAAVLGTVAPPVAGGALAPGLSAGGADFATTTRVKLTTASGEPGANGFVARVSDYDSGAPVRGARVRLRFVALDDPDVEPTSLQLAARRDGAYAASGANLAFDGRWRVVVLVQRARDAVAVPLEIDVPSPEHFISVQRVPGRAPQYTAQLIGAGYVRVVVDPERAGPSTVTVTAFTVFEDFADVDALVLTTAAGGGPAQVPAVTRRGRRFVARVALARGANTVAVVARTRDGTRMRAVFKLDVAG